MLRCCVFLIFLVVGSSVLYATPKGVSVLSGYGRDGSLIECADKYEIVPFALNISFDMGDMAKKWIFKKYPGYFEVQVEPFLNGVISPDNNVEFGVSLMLAWYFNLKFFKPFVRGGIGPGYTTQHLREQATQWNFFDTAGIGVEFPISQKSAVIIEYRYRHFSNADIKKPNKGIDTDIILLGYRKDF